jgi:uncharacterized protein (DUF433 family)
MLERDGQETEMRLEDYFDFQRPDDIRIMGHRIGIESVLEAYLEDGIQPREIVERYPSLSLEKVYATILYYLQNKVELDAYYQAHVEYCRESREESRRNPTEGTLRLLAIKAELDKLPEAERNKRLQEMAAERRAEEKRASRAVTAEVA